MCKILYGVAGEGYGHSSRSKEIISHLQDQGHIVKVVSYGKGYEVLAPLFDVTEIFGLHLYYENNQVNYLKTVWQNLLGTMEAQASLRKVINLIEDFQPEIVFTDFEPLTCLAANYKRIPLISIDNQHRLTVAPVEYPRQYTQYAMTATTIIRMMVPRATEYVALSFFDGVPRSKNECIVPPVIRREVIEKEITDAGHLLVYLTSPSVSLIETLHQVDRPFIVYGYGEDRQDGNVQFKNINTETFINDLASASGVIATAGFSLISEALYLAKPYLAIPIHQQFEQIVNGCYLEKLGYGKYYDEIDADKINDFIDNLDSFRSKLENYDRHGNERAFEVIDELVGKYSQVKD